MDYVSVRAESDQQIRDILNNRRKLKPIYANVDIQTRRSRINLWRWSNSTVLIYWTIKACSVIPVRYTKYSSNLKRKRQKLLENTYRLKLAFRNTPIVAFRGDKSLKDISVHEKHNNLFFKKQHLCELCGATKCVMCKYMICSSQFQDSKDKISKLKIISIVSRVMLFMGCFAHV